jgi:hypothetical protein
LDTLPFLVKKGFLVWRYDGSMVSIIRDNEYVDFYFFRKSFFRYRINNPGLTAKAKYLENTVPYSFLGESFHFW